MIGLWLGCGYGWAGLGWAGLGPVDLRCGGGRGSIRKAVLFWRLRLQSRRLCCRAVLRKIALLLSAAYCTWGQA